VCSAACLARLSLLPGRSRSHSASGVAGAIAGAFTGYEVRKRLVRALKVPDFVIALLEDAVAIGGGLLIVSRF
jgi:uncharacterized membrane protein